MGSFSLRGYLIIILLVTTQKPDLGNASVGKTFFFSIPKEFFS